MKTLIALIMLLAAPLQPEEEARAQSIGALLRCPVCQGMPIADSPAPMARDMMSQVRTMVQQGDPDEVIITYFTDRYGEWVRLSPKPEGLGLGLWILPAFFAILAITIFYRRAVRGSNVPPGPPQ